MADLKTNLEQILQEKQSKIIPENIKKDIQIFDIVDNDYDYIYLHTYISQGNLQSVGIIFNDSNAFSPVTDYNKALETSKEIKGIN